MDITILYAGLLALWFLVLSVRVIVGRGKGISLGDGGDKLLLRRIRAHGNFAEYVPLVLLMMMLLENQGVSSWILHALGATLLGSRLAHGYALGFSENFPPGRLLGAAGTLLCLLLGGALCVWNGLAL